MPPHSISEGSLSWYVPLVRYTYSRRYLNVACRVVSYPEILGDHWVGIQKFAAI